jgi:hypothetical protein
MTESPPASAPDVAWVPADRRWLGLDKRSFGPALFVLAVVIILAGVIPAIDNAISWTNQTKAGDVIDMGGGITFAAPEGWTLTDGFRTTDDGAHSVSPSRSTAVLANGGVQIEVKGGAWPGTADALLSQLNKNLTRNEGSALKVAGAPVSITTDAGDTGVTETYQSGSSKGGRLAAFTFPAGGTLSGPIGLAFTITGPDTTLAQYEPEIETMLRSVSQQAGS